MEDFNKLMKDFKSDFPYDKNVFIMIKYSDADYFKNIEETITKALKNSNLTGHFAKDSGKCKTLWNNVELYMNCCKYGIIVFEEIDRRTINPNISIELGYMLGQQKRCLVLKEKRMTDLPTNIGGLIYHEFDFLKLETLNSEIENWIIKDLKIISKDTALRLLVKQIYLNIENEYYYEKKILDLLYSSYPEGLKKMKMINALLLSPEMKAEIDIIKNPYIDSTYNKPSPEKYVNIDKPLQFLKNERIIEYHNIEGGAIYYLTMEGNQAIKNRNH